MVQKLKEKVQYRDQDDWQKYISTFISQKVGERGEKLISRSCELAVINDSLNFGQVYGSRDQMKGQNIMIEKEQSLNITYFTV